jgi:hypothetical protein
MSVPIIRHTCYLGLNSIFVSDVNDLEEGIDLRETGRKGAEYTRLVAETHQIGLEGRYRKSSQVGVDADHNATVLWNSRSVRQICLNGGG